MWYLTQLLTCWIGRRLSSLLAILSASVLMGLLLRQAYQQFLYLQAQNVSGLSVFNEIVLPLAGLAILIQILLSMLAGLQLLPAINAVGQLSIVHQSALSPARKLFALVFPLIIFGGLPFLLMLLVLSILTFQTPIDMARMLLMLMGLALINIVSSLLICWVCLKASRVLFAAIQALVVVAAVLLIESGLSLWWVEPKWQGMFLPFLRLREGQLVFADLVSYSGWLIFLWSICLARLRSDKTNARQKLISIAGAGVLLLAAFVPGQLDLSRDQRNSLAAEAFDALVRNQQKLELTAVVDQQSAREEIQTGYSLIRQRYQDAELLFRSRQSLPPKLQHAGEYLRITLGEAQVLVPYPFDKPVKQVFEQAIVDLAKRKQSWVVFVEGHGEGSPFGDKSTDMGEFYRELKSRGWPVAAVNLNQTPVISDNTEILVIAASRSQWLNSEVTLVTNYLRGGGKLLLLIDPDSVVPNALEQFLGIERFPGTLVDWKGYQSGTPHPAVVISESNGEHPALKQLKGILAFPWASALKVKKQSGQFTAKSLLTTHAGVWNEFDIASESLAHDAAQGELQQSFSLAFALESETRGQRAIVVGDSHFISDAAINNYANKALALSLITWLASETISTTSVEDQLDHALAPSRWGHFTFSWGFSLLLPLIILLTGGLQTMLRRRRWRLAFERQNQKSPGFKFKRDK